MGARAHRARARPHLRRAEGRHRRAEGGARWRKTRAERTRWVSYLRVSTVEQAEKELSLTAQRRSAEEFADRHDAIIEHHYLEPGASGTATHRPVFNELLGDALAPGSTISTIVVHHTSRFTRDATHVRVVKKQLRRAGVRVLSVTQELTEDPMGTLMEGFFECIDQYESELNGLRTSAAMRELKFTVVGERREVSKPRVFLLVSDDGFHWSAASSASSFLPPGPFGVMTMRSPCTSTWSMSWSA